MQSLLVASLGLSVLIYPFDNECNNIHLILLSCSIKPLEILTNFLSKLHIELVIQNLQHTSLHFYKTLCAYNFASRYLFKDL